MKTLAEWNGAQHKALAGLNGNEPRPNNIVCPNCGAELVDSQPMFVLASSPPQKDVHCLKCDFSGYRVA